MAQPRTMFDKIWERHAITKNEAGQTLLFIDRHFCHELSFHAYNMLHGRKARGKSGEILQRTYGSISKCSV